MYFDKIYRGKRVLVTGHTGFKGSWLSQWLIELGAQVAGVALDPPTQPSLFETLALKEYLYDVRSDIRHLEKLQTLIEQFSPEIIFHLAAQPLVKTSLTDPLLTFQTNLNGTLHLLEALKKCPSVKAAVFITSDKCYENKEWEYGYRETDPLGGKDPYSASKACAEIAISSYFRSYFSDSHRLSLATARAGNVIGGGDWADHRVVPDCVRSWSEGKAVSLRSPHSTRPWQHVLEPLSGYLLLGARLLERNDRVLGESFNFGPSLDAHYSVLDVTKALGRTLGRGFNWEIQAHSEIAAKEAGLLRLVCDKALSRLLWKPVLDFDETAEFTASWYKHYYEKQIDMRKFTLEQINSYCALALKRGITWTQEP